MPTCSWCGAEKRVETGLCTLCFRFPPASASRPDVPLRETVQKAREAWETAQQTKPDTQLKIDSGGN